MVSAGYRSCLGFAPRRISVALALISSAIFYLASLFFLSLIAIVSLFLILLLLVNKTRDDMVRWHDTIMLLLFSGEIIRALLSSLSSQ